MRGQCFKKRFKFFEEVLNIIKLPENYIGSDGNKKLRSRDGEKDQTFMINFETYLQDNFTFW